MNENMLCTKTHEYVLGQGGKYVIGITDYAMGLKDKILNYCNIRKGC